ncbi:hypothetical protein SISSUDRAFT_1066839 [Sistotremastrum suecicum HHB10207 ss-3]|uniref:Alpha-type protein kinase domain-containing protein n=1 Tax=Sistotremastrum suecicum HHB10207 ss-3 TaxID=1314776 RepID=A0A165XU62_9AGAM|nr:hypothetical protein SISSUDRAFT_1066839 [Sistotremastrum suecicum HHB10207 ss-3]
MNAKRSRSNTVASASYDPVLASPPRKRSTRATQALQSPIRSPYTNTTNRFQTRRRPISFELSFIVPHLDFFTGHKFDTVYGGKITDRPFNNTGVTKDVYQLKVDSKMSVSKEFRHSANSFLIEVDTPNTVEPRPPLNTPKSPSASSSSGSPQESPKVWLCEPFIPDTSTLRKFSGTMDAGANNDLAGASADALAHLSLIATKGRIVLADLQGFIDSSKRTSDNRPVCVLFDNMAHFNYDTRLKMIDNGGQKGIDAFTEQHVCGSKCLELGLNTLNPLTEDCKRHPNSISSLLTAAKEIVNEHGDFIEGQSMSMIMSLSGPGTSANFVTPCRISFSYALREHPDQGLSNAQAPSRSCASDIGLMDFLLPGNTHRREPR